MMGSSHFTRIADAQGVDAKTVERDYVLTHVLAAIAQQPAGHGMVFKGGTALRMCYFEDYRYSADLDFSLLTDADSQTALDVVAAALEELTIRLELPRLALTEDSKYIEYVGPLGKQRDLKLDVATDEVVEETTTLPLLARYRDQPDVQVTVYTLDEIAAEKLRCVIQRLQARDLFDLNELFVVNALDVEEIWPVFERKAHHKSIDPARFGEMFEQRMPQWKSRWETEMSEHLAGEPEPFKAVERRVRRALRSKLRSG
jgi:predicted nucleotidyltransferase component of viral defense system